jgi:hypothetical protein
MTECPDWPRAGETLVVSSAFEATARGRAKPPLEFTFIETGAVAFSPRSPATPL